MTAIFTFFQKKKIIVLILLSVSFNKHLTRIISPFHIEIFNKKDSSDLMYFYGNSFGQVNDLSRYCIFAYSSRF